MATLEIELWGEKIRLNSDKDHDFIMQVAEYLNGRMEEISKDPTLITTKIAALRAAFTIAAEYMMLKQEISKLESVVDSIDEQLKNSGVLFNDN